MGELCFQNLGKDSPCPDHPGYSHQLWTAHFSGKGAEEPEIVKVGEGTGGHW